MTAPKLPEGFTLAPYLDGNALRMGGTMIAHSAVLRCGSARVALKDGTASLRFVFVGSAEAADRYMAGWCVRWEAEIRELYRGLGVPV